MAGSGSSGFSTFDKIVIMVFLGLFVFIQVVFLAFAIKDYYDKNNCTTHYDCVNSWEYYGTMMICSSWEVKTVCY